jgi:hypothetical protein
MRASSLRRSLASLSLLTVAACDEGIISPLPPGDVGTITVDASASYAYVALEGDALVSRTIATPATSAEWDLGLFSTTVTSNGGAAGPGGVEVACICANEAATDDEVMAMSPESELDDFEAVTGAVLGDLTFMSDALSPAIAGWYTGSGAAATLVAGRSWIIREGSPTAVLAKFRVTAIAGASAESMGLVTFEYAVQSGAGEAFGAVQSVQLAVGTAPVYYDLTTGAVTTTENWDVQFSGWTIRLNSGVSGSGTVRSVLDTTMPFEDIDATYAASAPAQAFSADAFGGAFSIYRWYRYNITGTDNQIWPTFNVYVVRRGGVAYKVQLTSYYGPTGTPRQITLRYQRLGE